MKPNCCYVLAQPRKRVLILNCNSDQSIRSEHPYAHPNFLYVQEKKWDSNSVWSGQAQRESYIPSETAVICIERRDYMHAGEMRVAFLVLVNGVMAMMMKEDRRWFKQVSESDR